MGKDHILIEKIRRGDHEAFSLLVKPYLSTAFKIAFLILRSKEHAEDALQNALEGAYINISNKKEMTNFKSWFYSLVYSRSIDIYRINTRKLHINIEDNNEAQVKMSSHSAQQVAIITENKKEMIGKIMGLKREQSLPLFLHYYENLPVKEISIILNENINTVKTRMKRGKKQLAQILKESTSFIQEVNSNGV